MSFINDTEIKYHTPEVTTSRKPLVIIELPDSIPDSHKEEIKEQADLIQDYHFLIINTIGTQIEYTIVRETLA